MAYIQGANPFSRRRGKAKREAKKQLKSLYKQGYYQPTKVTQPDGSVSYKAGGPNEGEQKLNRQARRDIRREARGEDMGDPIQNYDQKGHRTTELVREGINRMSSSPLNRHEPGHDEYNWEVESGDPRTGLANAENYEWTEEDWGNETQEKMDDGRIKVQQSRGITGVHTGPTDDDYWNSLSEGEKQEIRDRASGTDTRTRYIDPQEPVNVIPPEEIVPPVIDTPDTVIPVTPGPTEEQIQIGKSERRINEKVPVTTTKDVERRKPGMQKVCTNWEWVERGSGQGESRSDAGPRPTVTKTKTKTRMRRI